MDVSGVDVISEHYKIDQYACAMITVPQAVGQYVH